MDELKNLEEIFLEEEMMMMRSVWADLLMVCGM